jgi:DeoR/GlpR family transcriptional regulator of sugar metabolism
MLATERRSRILEVLTVRRIASTEELATELQVSVETIRRDITALDGQQALRRVRGGAAAASSVAGEAVFEDRRVMNQAAKEAIARRAAELVEPGQVVFLDIGTTAVQVARALSMTFHGVVATSSLLVAAELAGHSGIDVLVAGGRVRGGDLSCSNAHSVAQAGLSDFHLDEVATRLQMMANARASYVLADSSKFGVIAPYAVCDWTKLAGVICERPPSAPMARAITSGGGRIISD